MQQLDLAQVAQHLVAVAEEVQVVLAEVQLLQRAGANARQYTQHSDEQYEWCVCGQGAGLYFQTTQKRRSISTGREAVQAAQRGLHRVGSMAQVAQHRRRGRAGRPVGALAWGRATLGALASGRAAMV